MSRPVAIFDAGRIRHAVLYRAGRHPGVRTALWVELRSAVLPAGHCFEGTAGFWLAESVQGWVTCFASTRPPTGQSVGGRVVHGLPVLDPDGRWLRELAQALAGSPGTRSFADTEHRTLRQAVTAFCAELDADILAAAQEEGEATPAAYNHYCHSHARVRRNRLQAAEAYPRFAGALRCDWRLRRAVEAGSALTRSLAAHYRVREATIKRLRGLERGCIPAEALHVAVKYADTLPPQAIPSSPEDWAVFLRLAPGLEMLNQRAGVAPANLLQPFRIGWTRGLEALEERLRSPLDLDAVLEMMHCAYHYGVRPAVAATLKQLGRSATLAESPPASFFPLWFGRYGLARLAEIAQRWQETHGQFSLERLSGSRLADHGVPLAWPSLLDSGASHDGLRVVELTSRAALELEGRRLDHCVASYAIKCLLAESAIFSVRDASGAPLSTFEVRVPATAKPELLQHYARADETPSEREQYVARSFVECVLARTPRNRIEAVQRSRRELGLQVRGLLGKPNTLQKPLSPKELARLGEAISIAHPAEARRAGLFRFLEEQGAAVLAAMGGSKR